MKFYIGGILTGSLSSFFLLWGLFGSKVLASEICLPVTWVLLVLTLVLVPNASVK